MTHRRIVRRIESSINRNHKEGWGDFTGHQVQITSHRNYGARKRTRTSTPLRELAPEASASANSAIRAYQQLLRGELIVPAHGCLCQRGHWRCSSSSNWVRFRTRAHAFAAPPINDLFTIQLVQS